MYFWTARLIRNAPRRCTPSTVSQSSSVILNSRLSRITPALLTSTVGAPSSPATRSTAASTWSRWLTSAPTANARPPASAISFTVPAQAASSRSRTPTAIPSAASLRAVAAPMPRAAPVTIATVCVTDVSPLFATGRGACCRLPQLAAGERPLVYLVRAVGEPERARAGPQVGQREVLAHPSPAVGLDGLVEHPLGHGRGHDLDRLDLAVRALVAHGVHQPRGLEHQQPGLLDPDPGLGDPVLDDPLLGQRLAERGPGGHALARELQGVLSRADLPHAVVDAPGAQPRLRDREPLSLPGDQVLGRDVHVGEDDLGVAAVRPVGVAEHPHPAPDLDPGGVGRDQDHGVPAVAAGGFLAGHAHHDQDLAVRAERAGRPPLAAVDHVAVTGAADRGGDVRRVAGRHAEIGRAHV